VKHIVDIDEDALEAARRTLGTSSIKETVNAALQQIGRRAPTAEEIDAAFEVLGSVPDDIRDQAWR
jgi:Arc/MetJ family transcription regulator